MVPPRVGTVEMRKRSLAEIQELNRASSPPSHAIIPASAHHLHQYLHLVAALGANPEPVSPRLEVTRDEVAAVKKRFGCSTDSTGPLLLGLNPGAEYGPAKRWLRERFVAAAIELQRRTNCHWWIFGGEADEPLASSIAAAITAAKAGPPGSVRTVPSANDSVVHPPLMIDRERTRRQTYASVASRRRPTSVEWLR